MNAVMGPAIRVRRSGGLVPAKTPTAAARVNPGGIPSAGWLVVQNNGVAKSVGEGALTVGLGEAGEGGAPVGGDRCAGDVVAGGASRVVVGDDDLVGVIWVSRSECLRLGNVGRSLRAGDQVDVRGAIRQGRQQFLDKLVDGTESGSRRSRTALCLAAGNHDGSGPEVLLLVDAQLVNFGTVKAGRDEWVGGLGDNVLLLLRLCGESAKAHQRQKDASQDHKPAH